MTKGKIIPFAKAAERVQKKRAKRFVKATCSHFPPAIEVGYWDTGVAKFTCLHCGAVVLPEDAWHMMGEAYEELVGEVLQDNRELKLEINRLRKTIRKLSSDSKRKPK